MQRPRNSIIILTAVVLGLTGTQIAGVTDLAAASGPTEPVIIHGADAETTTLIERAVDRYGQVGLELPNLEFFVHTDGDRASCDGYMGLWHRGGWADRIDVCVAVEWLILHEIAHAWDSHAVDDSTRTAFMAQYPDTEWEDQTIGRRDQGIERFAQTIAWGLGFTPIPVSKFQALQEQIDVFEMITGVTPPRLTDIGA